MSKPIRDFQLEDLEIWKPYRETGYYASSEGRIKHVLKNGNINYLKPHRNESSISSDFMTVKIHGRPVRVARIVYEAFYGEIPKGFYVVHKNHIYSDNHINNLELCTPAEAGRIGGTNKLKRNIVYDIDNDCFYPNPRVAGEKLYICSHSIWLYCNGKVQKPLFNVRWDSPRSKTVTLHGKVAE